MAVTDLSHLFRNGTVDAVVPTGQGAGGDADPAPVTPPHVDAAGHDRSVTTDGQDGPPRTPFRMGGGWDGRNEIPGKG